MIHLDGPLVYAPLPASPRSRGKVGWGVFAVALGLLALTTAASCGSSPSDSGDDGSPGPTARPTATGRPTATPTPTPLPLDLSTAVWLHTNVSTWRETATLKVTFEGSNICLDFSKTNVWPAAADYGTPVNANPWVFVHLNGVWYAGTWEWLRPGQICKPKSAVSGSRIEVPPLASWSPRRGETYGFMVSGLARDKVLRNVEERSEVVFVVWP